MHSRSPAIACLRGAPQSARKSSLKSFGDETVHGDQAAPDTFNTKSFVATDGTLRVLRGAATATNHCGVVSDECSNTCETPWSEGGKGIHYLQRSKVCTCCNAEIDASLTGKSVGHINRYFLVSLYGSPSMFHPWLVL